MALELKSDFNAPVSYDTILEEPYVGGQSASAASLLGLPVELQTTILEYVRSMYLGL